MINIKLINIDNKNFIVFNKIMNVPNDIIINELMPNLSKPVILNLCQTNRY